MVDQLPNHPGFIDYSQVPFGSIETLIRNRGFYQFEPFMQPRGIDSKTQIDFRTFLWKLFERTKRGWEPGECMQTATTVIAAREILDGNRFVGIFDRVEPRRFSHSHFWLEVFEPESDRGLIVDPSGVPEMGQYFNKARILPYFGLAEFAPEFHKVIYLKGQNIDDWGYRDLPPGFHP